MAEIQGRGRSRRQTKLTIYSVSDSHRHGPLSQDKRFGGLIIAFNEAIRYRNAKQPTQGPRPAQASVSDGVVPQTTTPKDSIRRVYQTRFSKKCCLRDILSRI
jgi:hypothetical protein